MSRIIFATGNADKMKEIRMILSDIGMEILSMKEAGISADIVEDGATFEENAMIKARAIAKLAPEDIILADDSGLEIDYLNKEPGVYSARYMGEDTSYAIKNQNLIDRLDGVPKEQRTARFVCAIAAVLPDGSTRRHAVQSRDTSDGSLRELMGSVMIRSFMWMNMAAPRRNCLRNRKMRSATGEMHYGRCVRSWRRYE